MYLISSVEVPDDMGHIPVCCYLPYSYHKFGDLTDYTCGYFTSENGVNIEGLYIAYFDHNSIIAYKVSSKVSSNALRTYYGFSRLVRPLTEEELNEYKAEYLGYGEKPHRLTLCHPDTYESSSLGWLPY